MARRFLVLTALLVGLANVRAANPSFESFTNGQFKVSGNRIEITNLNGSVIQSKTINSNKLDAATRALIGVAVAATNADYATAAGTAATATNALQLEGIDLAGLYINVVGAAVVAAQSAITHVAYADNATTAGHATTADFATLAGTTNAFSDYATNAGYADLATNSLQLGGRTAVQYSNDVKTAAFNAITNVAQATTATTAGAATTFGLLTAVNYSNAVKNATFAAITNVATASASLTSGTATNALQFSGLETNSFASMISNSAGWLIPQAIIPTNSTAQIPCMGGSGAPASTPLVPYAVYVNTANGEQYMWYSNAWH